MVRTWLATSTALVAAVALSLSVTEAGARDYHGNAPHFRSGPGPSMRHFQSTVRSQPQVHFKSSGGPVHFNTNYRVQRQVNVNGVGVGRVERHVDYRVAHRHHHRLGRPIINFGLPYVYEPGYYANNECYAWQPAMTPYGWRYMWVYVCDDGVDDLDN